MKPVGPRARFALAVVTFAAGIACGVVILIPIAELSGWVSASWLRLGFHPACHQITERCLDLGAGPLPICARCAGLYAGGFAGLFITLSAAAVFSYAPDGWSPQRSLRSSISSSSSPVFRP